VDKTKKPITRIINDINDPQSENKLKDKKFDIFELFYLTPDQNEIKRASLIINYINQQIF
jgi:hypothetical protein